FEWTRDLLEALADPDERFALLAKRASGVPRLPMPLEPDHVEVVTEVVTQFVDLLREDWLREPASDVEVADAYALLVDRCLASRRFRVGSEAQWLCPDLTSLGPSEIDAIERVR